jgi:large repetitive protein
LNGVATSPSNTTLSVTTGTTIPAGLTFNTATGAVDVAAGTPAGTYVVNYTICETLNPTNCKDATISVTVAAATLAVTALPTAVTGGVGTTLPVDLLGPITINGGPATTGVVTVTITVPAVPSAPGLPVPTVDPVTGIATIPTGTPAGPYPITYEVCERLNPTNCVSTTVTVNVLAGSLTLAPDTLPSINGATGGVTGTSVFTNDILNNVVVTPETTTVTVTTPATPINGGPVPTLNPTTGLVTVAPGTPAGTYNIVYQVCETLNPANCASQTATVVVTAAVLELGPDPVIAARQGIGGTNIANVLTNDTLNGVAVTPATTTLTVVAPASNAGVILDPATGQVSVGPNVPAGTYVIEYQLCETLNPSNCQTSRVEVLVEAPISSVSGTVYSDLNGNGQLDSNETRRPGWIIELVRNGTVVATTTTDANGNYLFDGVASGPGYEIVFRNPENNVVYERIGGLTLGDNTTVVDQNQPIDPSGVVYDSITRTPVTGAIARLLDSQGNALPTACFISASQQSQTTGATGSYRFDLVPGSAAQCPLSQSNYSIQITTPAGYSSPSSVIVPQAGAFDPTGMAGPVRIASVDGPPTGASPVYYLQFALQNGDPDVVFNHIPVDPFLTRTPLVVTKTSIKRTANTGDLVPYEIVVRNTENAQRSGVTVVDILPPGMKYVLGTASVNGVASEPEKTDRQVAWRGQVIPANASAHYNLTLVVGAGVSGGEKVNTGLAQTDANGTAISNRGTAVISIVPSAVFDCSELLGKVFEDTNRNGYQDESEPGVPGVRLATVNGQLITTDAFGRYHIACAAVPDARIGSNFVLKVDTRTLPLGWNTTTDNPRSIRLTRGKFGELNFGVAPNESSTPTPGDTSATRNEKGE